MIGKGKGKTKGKGKSDKGFGKTKNGAALKGGKGRFAKTFQQFYLGKKGKGKGWKSGW